MLRPGHGATSKPAGGFKYDAAAHQGALDAFIAETGIAADEQIDLIVSGFFTRTRRDTAGRAGARVGGRFADRPGRFRAFFTRQALLRRPTSGSRAACPRGV